MWNNFFKHIDIHPENTHILDGNAADLQAECDAFEEKIKAAGGIELFVGGELDTAARVQARPGVVRTHGKQDETHVCLQTTSSLCAMTVVAIYYPGKAESENPSSPPCLCCSVTAWPCTSSLPAL